MNENIQQENPELLGFYQLAVEDNIVQERIEQKNITELFQTNSSDEFVSQDGFVLCAKTSKKGKSIALSAKDEGIRKNTEFESTNSKTYGQSGYIGALPKDMDCLSDDPQRVVDNLVNQNKLFGKKFVVSKSKNK